MPATAIATAPIIVSELASLSLEVSTREQQQIAVNYRNYRDENDIKTIVDLIAPYLSEPYSIYCYRYFLHGWSVAISLSLRLSFVGLRVCTYADCLNGSGRSYARWSVRQ